MVSLEREGGQERRKIKKRTMTMRRRKDSTPQAQRENRMGFLSLI